LFETHFAPKKLTPKKMKKNKKEKKEKWGSWDFRRLLSLIFEQTSYTKISFNLEGCLEILVKEDDKEITIQLFPDKKWEMFFKIINNK
jgi:hypothetical protein